MAKKRSLSSGSPGILDANVEGSEEEKKEPEADIKDSGGKKESVRLWDMGVWKGLSQWRCRLCRWDTLDGEEAMLKHIAEVHTKKKTREFLIADRRGRPVEEKSQAGAWRSE